MKPLREKHVDLSQWKYVKVTDKITIQVPIGVDDDEARETFLLKISEAERRKNKTEKEEER